MSQQTIDYSKNNVTLWPFSVYYKAITVIEMLLVDNCIMDVIDFALWKYPILCSASD